MNRETHGQDGEELPLFPDVRLRAYNYSVTTMSKGSPGWNRSSDNTVSKGRLDPRVLCLYSG